MFIKPMLLEKSTPFNSSEFIAEWKQDGWRMIVSNWGTEGIKLYSRHHNEFTSVFTEFKGLSLPEDTVIDCELIAVNAQGKCDFELLQEQYKSKNRDCTLQLVVFDILFYKGMDLRQNQLFERKMILDEVIHESPLLVISRCVDGIHAVEYFNLIKQHNLEGIVMKEKNSKYVSKRSHSWLKVLNLSTTDVYITGLRKREFGVYLSYLDGSYAGIIEFMKPQDREKIYSLIPDLKIGENKDKILFKQKQIIQVVFRNKFKSGLLRIPQLNMWK